VDPVRPVTGHSELVRCEVHLEAKTNELRQVVMFVRLDRIVGKESPIRFGAFE